MDNVRVGSLGVGRGRIILENDDQIRVVSPPMKALSPYGRGWNPVEQGVMRSPPLAPGLSRQLGDVARPEPAGSPEAQDEMPTSECHFCSRPTMLIICRSCGHTFTGRVRAPCVNHPTTIHLMDSDCCPACLAYQIQEFKQALSPAIDKNSARKKLSLDENQNVEMW